MAPAAPSFYIVGSLGYAQHDIDEDEFGRRVSGVANLSSSVDDGDFAWRVTGGWQALPWLGVEFSYFDLGSRPCRSRRPCSRRGRMRRWT